MFPYEQSDSPYPLRIEFIIKGRKIVVHNYQKRWVFTWNADDEGWLINPCHLEKFLNEIAEEGVFQKEKGLETNRLHMQGRFVIKGSRIGKRKLLTMFEKLGDTRNLTFSPERLWNSSHYCVKDETRVGGPWYVGIPKYRRKNTPTLRNWQKQLLNDLISPLGETFRDRKVIWIQDEKGVPEKNIRVEVGSAADKTQNRPVFSHLIDDELKENDLLLVTKIDRCSRNTLEFLKLQERLHKKGVRFISLDLPYSNDMAVNQLISTNLAAIATFENERRKDRQRQGIQAAKKNGKYFGRKTVIDKKLISQVQDLKENKNLSITEISKITGRARNTIYKILKQELNYIPYNRLVKATKGEINEGK